MPTITFDVGGANISVPCQRAGKAAKRRLGAAGPTANGNLRSFIRDEFHEIPLILIRILPAEAAAIEVLFEDGAIVACAGDVFNNGGATVRCLGDYTDNMEPADTLRTPSIFLHEVGEVTAGLPPTSGVFLWGSAGTTGAGEDPSAGTPFLAGIGGSGGGSVRVLDAATPPTCGTFPDPSVTCTVVYSGVPEATFATPPFVRDGWLTGVPRVEVASIGGTGDQWAHQGSLFRISLFRGSSDVRTIDTQYGSNGGFAGGAVMHSAASSILWQGLTGDRLRIEIWGRLALHGGYADDNPAPLARQTILWGPSPVYMGGLLAVLTP